MLLTILALLAAPQPSMLTSNDMPATGATTTVDDAKALCETRHKEATEHNAKLTNQKVKDMMAPAIEQSYQNCLRAAEARAKK